MIVNEISQKSIGKVGASTEYSVVGDVLNITCKTLILERDGDNNIISTETIKESSDYIDFSGLPDGELVELDTELHLSPISNCRKENGIVYLDLIIYDSEG